MLTPDNKAKKDKDRTGRCWRWQASITFH